MQRKEKNLTSDASCDSNVPAPSTVRLSFIGDGVPDDAVRSNLQGRGEGDLTSIGPAKKAAPLHQD